MKYQIVALVSIIGILSHHSPVNGVKLRHSVIEALAEDPALTASNPNFCTTLGGCPQGSYSTTCNQCFVNPATGSLTCNCLPNSQSVTIANAWACSSAINNVNGQLTCVYPPGTSGWYSYNNIGVCQGCYLQGPRLFCNTCNSVNNVFLDYATSCTTGIEFNPAISQLVCVAPTPSPTFPTASPTFPTPNPTFPTPAPTWPTPMPTTLSPTLPTRRPTTTPPTLSPQNAGPVCQGAWLQVQANGEAAPKKTCTYVPGYTQFTSQTGCQGQNFCCWNSQSNTCGLPVGVPVECSILNAQQCASFPTYCQWNSSVGSPRCQRLCPGNPAVLCPNA